MEKKIRVAILGQGRSGRNIHGAHLKTDDRFEIVAVVDPLADRRERAMQEYGIADVYATVQELYGRSDIDLVVNSTPSPLHQPLAVELMKHGYNVLQEKPIAGTKAQVEELEATIAETGKTYLIFLQSRYAPQFVKVREVAESGVLGRLVQVKITCSGYNRRWDWQTLQENVAGSLYNSGPHPVGQALEFLNYYDGMPEVWCHMDRANTFGDAEDFCKLMLRAPGRPIVDVEISCCDAYPTYTFEIQGTRGTLLANNATVRWKYFKEEESPEQHLIREPLRSAEGLPIYCSEKLTWYEEEVDNANITDNVFADATRRLYDDVYNKLVNGIEPNVTIKQVKQQICVMEEAHRQNPLSRLEENV